MYNIKATEDDGIELLYRGRSLDGVPFERIEQFNSWCDLLEIHPITDQISLSEEFQIPQHYKDIHIPNYVFSLVDRHNAQAVQRVQEELQLFESKNLYPILQLLIYIVDTLRKHNIVWGVGRGSSVASYCLYLMGVHKIDSLKYQLDIKEFLK